MEVDHEEVIVLGGAGRAVDSKGRGADQAVGHAGAREMGHDIRKKAQE